MVTPEDVVAAYRLILGRDPESESAISTHMHGAVDVNDLRRTFLSSLEFRSKFNTIVSTCFEPGGPIRVDTECDPERLAVLFDRVQTAWTKMGESEPMWSVLTDDKFKIDRFLPHSAKFYSSGQDDVNRFLTWLLRNGQTHTTFERCLEFGCGVGRVTLWLARLLPHVIACDISKPHLQLAEAHLRTHRIVNTELLHIQSLAQLDLLDGVDAIFSMIVLQHNPPPIIICILRKWFHLLRPGGVAFFQVPTYWAGYSFNLEEYLTSAPPTDMEMHLLPQRSIFALAAECGCSVLEVEPDNYTGIANGVSNTFLILKSP
jgi:SAM-dependent methyltransferase